MSDDDKPKWRLIEYDATKHRELIKKMIDLLVEGTDSPEEGYVVLHFAQIALQQMFDLPDPRIVNIVPPTTDKTQ